MKRDPSVPRPVAPEPAGAAEGALISVERVTKAYGPVVAVKDASFSIRRDEIVGFLGPNGAGKTTMLRMLATFLAPTEGAVRVGGVDATVDPLAVRGRIGYLSGYTPLYLSMRVDKFLRFIAEAQGLDAAAFERRLAWVSKAFGLDPVLGRRVHQCSTGFRQRVGLAAALIHDPEVLLLDEPTQSFDPLQVLEFRDLLRSLKPGKAILFSSHIIAEVEAISDRVLVLNQGRLLGDGTVPELAARAGVPGGTLEQAFVGLVRRAGGR